MQKGYIFAELDITDSAYFYEQYMTRVMPVLERFGAVFLAGSDQVTVAEGERQVKRVVLVEFESPQRAREFYYSKDYQDVSQYRYQSARSHLYLFEGVPA